jgi:hypothetical protein
MEGHRDDGRGPGRVLGRWQRRSEGQGLQGYRAATPRDRSGCRPYGSRTTSTSMDSRARMNRRMSKTVPVVPAVAKPRRPARAGVMARGWAPRPVVVAMRAPGHPDGAVGRTGAGSSSRAGTGAAARRAAGGGVAPARGARQPPAADSRYCNHGQLGCRVTCRMPDIPGCAPAYSSRGRPGCGVADVAVLSPGCTPRSPRTQTEYRLIRGTATSTSTTSGTTS